MTDGNSVEHLSVVMTTETVDDVSETTAANVATSSSRGIEFYFQCAVVVIGVVGTAANALILYAMVASKEHKKQVLIFNQNVIDFVSSLFLIITYALKLCNIPLTGFGGYWLCMLILSENLIWCLILASKANLTFVTIERYLKVVHANWSKAKLRKWMVYLAMAFAWISGFVHNGTAVLNTSDVIDGVCYSYVIWKSRESQLAFGIWIFLILYVSVLAVFIFCYWRILIVIRHQANVMAGHSTAGQSTAQAQSNQIQSNVVKTMILVSAFYAICDLPIQVHFLILNVHANLTLLDSGHYATLFIAFFYFCANPFIYATKFDPVKRVLLSLIPCKKYFEQPIETVEVAMPRMTATRTAQADN